MYINPYQNLKDGKWCKTNYHTHAGTGYRTCGVNPIDRIVELYIAAEYDMLCISNHDTFTDASEFTGEKILMIPGVEYSAEGHMLTIGVNRSLRELDHQDAINATKEMGGFTIICHPNWLRKEYWPWEKLENLKGYVGLEILNMFIHRHSGSALATDTWDHLLSKGRMVYGFGSDDMHSPIDIGRAFNLIYCTERSYEGMKNAVESGAFCVSNGVYPDYLLLENDTIKVKAKHCKETYVDTYTYRFITEGGRVLSEQKGTVGEYKLNGEKYVRVEVMGEFGAMLYFQPVYLKEAFDK